MSGQKLLQILDNDLSAYPNVNISYFTFDEHGLPDFDYQMNDFEVKDNGKIVPVTHQNCFSINPSQSATVLLSVDLSIKNDTIDNKVDKTLLILKEIISNLNLYNVTAGLHSFDAMAYLNHDFTTNQNTLNSFLNTLLFSSGSIIDTGFSSKPLGSIELIKNIRGSKSIIYFSSTFSKFNSDKVIANARANSIKIFPVFLGNLMPADLQRVADSTDGFAILIPDTLNDFKGLALSLLALSKDYSPCKLVWKNELDCYDLHNETVSIASENIQDEVAFYTGNEFKPAIVSTPPYLRFSSVMLGSSKSLNLSFKAINGDLTISDLLLHNPKFSIDSGDIAAPVILPRDSSRTVKIKFTPTDSAIVFDSLEIVSDACSGTIILITGGYPNTPPTERTLTLLTPNCGENLIVNDTTTVSWTGLLPADVIQLQYSTDSGENWDTLATDITGLSYNWKVPDNVSDSCLVRVIQLWPNNIGQTMVLPHDGGVNCANFNRDGSLVVTASKDKKDLVRIWNANNGQLIYELEGHSKPVNWVNFDPNDKYAVSASDDKTIKIWDSKKGEIIRTLTGHKDVVRAANFSPSGKYLLSASKDGYGYLWDVETGNKIDSFSTGAPLWYAQFSPDEKYFVLTDDQGKAVVYNFETRKQYKVFNSGIGVIPYADFSHDMSKLATAGWFGKSIVWDFVSGNELYTVTHDSTKIIPINSCTFDNTDTYLLTAGADTVPRLWDANTGTQITTLLNEHTSSVQIATFNFDAKRILTASWDSTAKVWNREQIGLQVDTSDCVFSINRLKVEVDDINFADTPLGTITDSLVMPFIKNLLKFPIEVRNYHISGDNASDFEVINNLPPHSIDSMGHNYIEVRFNPSALGLRTAILEITLPGTVKEIKLSGNGIYGSLKLSSNVVDFGAVEIGDYKDTSVTLINNSGKPVRIDSLIKLGADFFHFNITNEIKGNIIQPGERLNIDLRFMPETIDRLNSVIRIIHNGTGHPIDLSMFGEGIQPRTDTATIVVGDGSGQPGELVSIPIKISGISSNGIVPTITGFNITLEFNSTLLAPTTADDINIVNGTRILKVQLPVTFDSDSVLKRLEFRIGLGNDTVSALKISELSIIGTGKMVLYGKDGLFRLNGYCMRGGNRLFESEGKIYLADNVPNPVVESTEITFEIIENGHSELYLVDILGNRIKTLVSSYLPAGIYTYQLNANELPSGKIFYILQTPTKIIVKSMDVLK
jgi:WD40 repeat protein